MSMVYQSMAQRPNSNCGQTNGHRNRAVGIAVADVACNRCPQIYCHLMRMALMVVLVKVPSFFLSLSFEYCFLSFSIPDIDHSIDIYNNQNKILNTKLTPLRVAFYHCQILILMLIHGPFINFQLSNSYNLISDYFLGGKLKFISSGKTISQHTHTQIYCTV